MRIQEHPILGGYEKGKLVSFTLDGKEMQGYEGEPIAAALKAAGVMGPPVYPEGAGAPGRLLCHRAVHRLCHDCGRRAQRPHLRHAPEGGYEGADPVRRVRKGGIGHEAI